MPADRLIRTFLAIEVPHEVVSLAKASRSMVTAPEGVVKWLRSHNVHVTLRFLGATPEEQVPPIRAAVEEVIRRHCWFNLRIEGTGVFPKRERPRVLWLGVQGETVRLLALVGDLNATLERFGFPVEERDYHPHVTIGRIHYPQKVTPDVGRFLNFGYEAIPLAAQKVTFFQSELDSAGAIYSILGSFHLKPRD